MNEYLKGLAHIGVYTEDLEVSKKFYVNQLGFSLESETKIDKEDSGWIKIAFVILNDLTIELLEPSNKKRVFKDSNGTLDHIAIEVIDLDKAIANLKLKGIQFETEHPILSPQFKIIFFRGPSNERIELVQYL